MDRKTLIYAAATYALFFAFIGLIGVVMLVLQAPPVVVTGLQMAASWTPTLALLLLFATLVPGEKRLRFIRRRFTARPDRRTLSLSVLPLTAILLGTVTTASLVRGEPITELVVLSPLTGFLLALQHLLSGPLGEELGWRGFLLPHLRRRHSFIKATTITGLLWCFWHTPLWLVSGYQGAELVLYIACFSVSIMCCNLMIAYAFDRCPNLLVPILVHFLNNFFLQLLTFDLVQGLALFAVCYAVVTTIFVAVEEPRRRVRNALAVPR